MPRKPTRKFPAISGMPALRTQGRLHVHPRAGPGSNEPTGPKRTMLMAAVGRTPLKSIAERWAERSAKKPKEPGKNIGTQLGITGLAMLSPEEREALLEQPEGLGLNWRERIQVGRSRKANARILKEAREREKDGEPKEAIYLYALGGDIDGIKKLLTKSRQAREHYLGWNVTLQAKLLGRAARGLRFNTGIPLRLKQKIIQGMTEKAEHIAQRTMIALSGDLGKKLAADAAEILAEVYRVYRVEPRAHVGQEFENRERASAILRQCSGIVPSLVGTELHNRAQAIARILEVSLELFTPKK